jgi:hypothetical protein
VLVRRIRCYFNFRCKGVLVNYFFLCHPYSRICSLIILTPIALLAVLTMATQAADLTTTFTPDKSCFQYYKYRYTGDEITCKEGGTGAPSACTYMQLGPSGSDAGCFPSSLELGSTFYYSPGVCPSGFEVACSSTFGGETRATCCPR